MHLQTMHPSDGTDPELRIFTLAQIFEKNELVLVRKKKNSRIDHKIQESRSCLPLGPSASYILKICVEDVNFFVDK